MARAVAALILALAALAAAQTVDAATIPGLVSGTAKVSDFYIASGGQTFEGGAFETNLVCHACYVRLTVVTSSITLVQDGAERTLAPGSYEIRTFGGFVGITTNGLHDFFFELHGTGTVKPWAP
jgi:hypothetical protein